MLVGASLDAGVSLEALETELRRLPVSGYRLEAAKVQRKAIAGTQFLVHGEAGSRPGAGKSHRHLPEIEQIVCEAGYDSDVEARILAAFRCLAEAEARVHDMPVEDVHFHEVGAVDAIVDICGAVLGLAMLGIDRVVCSEIVVGSGTVECAHGRMPVPAPGTAEILKGLPIRMTDLPGERCTPTGAALLRTLVDEFQATLSFRPLAIGYGAGMREDGPVPNLLRLTVGEVPDEPGLERVWELSVQVDNVSGEIVGHALRAAIDRGALDAWSVPSLTKKNRPAHWVVVLCDESRRDRLESLLLTELPTLGLRRNRVERRTLPRRVESRETPLGPLRFKVRTLPDGTELAHPEAEDIERIAREQELPVPVVWSRIQGA